MLENLRENSCGTYAFRYYSNRDIREIFAHFNTQRNLSCLILKSCVSFLIVNPINASNPTEATNSQLVAHKVIKFLQNSEGLQYLNLSNCKLQKKYIRLVCEALKFTNLLHINLSGNNIHNDEVELLVHGIARSTSLQHLELGCSLIQEGLQSICNAIKNSNLKTLNLNHNCITDAVAVDLASFIIRDSIENLQLKECSLKYNGIKALIECLVKVKSLKFLDLSHNRIADTSLDVAAVTSSNTNLEHLDLSYCEMCEGIMIKIFETNFKVLKALNFSGNRITESAVPHLINLVRNATSLQVICLSECCLQESGLIKIFSHIISVLKHVDLSSNPVSNNAAKSVADVICKDVEHLDLSNCQLQEEGFSLILKAVRFCECELKYIDLNSNHISIALAEDVAALISGNHRLDYLCLSNCSLLKEGFLKIANALEKTDWLISLDISSNSITDEVGVKTLALSDVFVRSSQLKHLNLSHCETKFLHRLLKGAMNLRFFKCINCSYCKIDEKEANLLSGLVDTNSTMEQLILANCELTPEQLGKILNKLKDIVTLKHLNLSGNKITEEVITTLAEVISCSPMEHLELSHCSLDINSVIVNTVANSVNTLQYLGLSCNNISNDDTSHIASAIVANSNLHHINLTNNNIAEQGLKIILNAMAKINSLQSINLHSYSITDDLAVDLEKVATNNVGLETILVEKYKIQNVQLEKVPESASKLVVTMLCINDQVIKDSEAYTFETIINNKNLIKNSSSINTIDLANCVIKEPQVLKIVKAIKQYSTLLHLNLNGVSITEVIQNELVSLVAHNTMLKHLELANCQIKENFFSHALKEIEHLNFSQNSIGTVVASTQNVLFESTKLKYLKMADCELSEVKDLCVTETLIHLDLSNNPNLHAGDVANLLAKNTKLQHLNLCNCGFDSSSGVLKILKVLKQLTGLLYYNLGSNRLENQLDTVASETAEMITNNKHIEEVHLPHCQFQDKDEEIILEAMTKISSLKHVDICHSFNQSSNQFIKAVFVENPNLEIFVIAELVLFRNELQNFCDDLSKFRIRHVSLYQCCISNKQLNQLCEMFSINPKVTHLSITDCLFSDKYGGMSKIFSFLKSTESLKHIDLNSVALTEDSLEVLIAANPDIKHFSLIDCKLQLSRVKNLPEVNKLSKVNMLSKVNLFRAFKSTRMLEYFSIKDIVITEQSSIEKSSTEQSSTDKSSTEQISIKKAAQNKVVQKKAVQTKAVQNKAIQNRAVQNKVVQNKAVQKISLKILHH